MANNLTARQIQTAKPKDKLYRLSDAAISTFAYVQAILAHGNSVINDQDKIRSLIFRLEPIPICLWRKLERKPLRLASS